MQHLFIESRAMARASPSPPRPGATTLRQGNRLHERESTSRAVTRDARQRSLARLPTAGVGERAARSGAPSNPGLRVGFCLRPNPAHAFLSDLIICKQTLAGHRVVSPKLRR